MLAFQTEAETASISFSKQIMARQEQDFQKEETASISFSKEETASISFLKMLDEASISFSKSRNSKY